MAKLTVRRAVAADADLIAPLFDQYRMFYSQKSSSAEAASFIAERLKNKDSVLFLALSDTTPVGFAQLYPTFSSVGMKRMWILNDLFVRSESRTIGVGKALMAACSQHSKETGARGLTLKTAVDNAPAQKLYAACGWAKETTFVSFNLKT